MMWCGISVWLTPVNSKGHNFGLEDEHWRVEDIDNLVKVSCKLTSQFSQDKMDLGNCIADPSKTELEHGTTPVEQRTYRHNPALKQN